jgi:hypothetical protein
MNPNDRTTDSLPISRRTVIINSGLAAAAIAGLSSCTMRLLRTASLLPPPAVLQVGRAAQADP